MKKILSIVLALAMVLSLAACGKKDNGTASGSDISSGITSEPEIDPTDEPETEPTDEPDTEPTDDPATNPTEKPVTPTNKPSTTPDASGNGADSMSLNDILTSMLSTSGFEGGPFYQSYAVTAADAGAVTGYEGISTDFEEALGYGPQIGSIPFSMVIFRLAEGADAEAFASSLKSGANPGKWICVCADTVETVVSGRTVLFIMSDTDSAAAFTSAFASLG